jgi:hypothetical protein
MGSDKGKIKALKLFQFYCLIFRQLPNCAILWRISKQSDYASFLFLSKKNCTPLTSRGF